jgi:dephospho-CoA kinase
LPLGLYSIIVEFGKDYLFTGTLDRAKLGHLIEEGADFQIAQAHKTNDIVVYDAALIIESGHSVRHIPLIVVSYPIDIRLSRLIKRNSLTPDEVMSRKSSQLSTEEKNVDYVIDSSVPIESSVKQTETIIGYLKGETK